METRVREALKPGFTFISIDQFGPDMTTVIGRIIFWICPVCTAMVPNPNTDVNPDYDFIEKHREYHIGDAKDLDELVGAMQRVLAVVNTITTGPLA